MTNKRKIQILKEMKKRIEGGYDVCLCGAYFSITGHFNVGEIGLINPAGNTFYGAFWFPRNEEGKQERIKLISKTIRKLSK